MKKVNDILKIKGHDVWSIAPDASVYDAIHLMTDKKVGALTVIEDSKLVGMSSETDYTQKILLKGRYSTNKLVKGMRTAKEQYIQQEKEREEVEDVMT